MLDTFIQAATASEIESVRSLFMAYAQEIEVDLCF